MNPYIDAYKNSSKNRQQKNRQNIFSAGVLAIFFLLGLSFLLVYKHTIGQHLLFQVQQLKAEQKSLITEQSVLLGDKQAVLSRARIIGYARERLELQFPGPEQIRWIRVVELNNVAFRSPGR